MHHSRVFIVSAALLALVSCNRDPNVAKPKYLDKGNKYFDQGKFAEARLMYKDAIQKDRRYGPAWYKLGLTELRRGQGSAAVTALRNAIDLVPDTSKDHWDAIVRLTELYLIAGGDHQIGDA